MWRGKQKVAEEFVCNGEMRNFVIIYHGLLYLLLKEHAGRNKNTEKLFRDCENMKIFPHPDDEDDRLAMMMMIKILVTTIVYCVWQAQSSVYHPNHRRIGRSVNFGIFMRRRRGRSWSEVQNHEGDEMRDVW